MASAIPSSLLQREADVGTEVNKETLVFSHTLSHFKRGVHTTDQEAESYLWMLDETASFCSSVALRLQCQAHACASTHAFADAPPTAMVCHQLWAFAGSEDEECKPPRLFFPAGCLKHPDSPQSDAFPPVWDARCRKTWEWLKNRPSRYCCYIFTSV